MMFSMAMWMAALVAPIQIFAGDLHGLNTLEHQPAKIAAMEGHFETPPGRRAADPVRHARQARSSGRDYAIEIPEARLADPHARPRRAAGRGSTACRRTTGRRRRSSSGASASWSAIGFADARRSACGQPVRALARQRSIDCRLAALVRAVVDGAVGLRRRAGGLDHHRGRPPALHGLWPAAHRRIGFAARRRRRSAPRCSPSSSSISRVFGAGTFYILRLMAHRRITAEHGIAQRRRCGPRGITPGPVRMRRDSLPTHEGGRRWYSISPFIWACLIAFAVLAYVVMDGFDLGIGILFPLVPGEAERDAMMNSRRAGLGRQRDLAGAGRRRPVRGVSAGLCGASCRRSTRRSSPCCWA